MIPIEAAVARQCSKPVNIHIDKIRIQAPCYHKPTGRLAYFDEDALGMVPVASSPNQKALKDGGKRAYIHSKDVNGRTGMANMIEIHCCPPLVLQRHNVFGHQNLQTYAYNILDLATASLGIDVREEDRDEWRRGAMGLTEIHLTGNFGCPHSAIVPVIQAVDDNNFAGKKRQLPTWITLDNGTEKNSTFYALTIYGKHAELKNKAAFRSPGPVRKKLLAETYNAIRAEVKIRSDGLKHMDLAYVSRWKNVDVSALFFDIFSKYNVAYAVQRLLTEDELQCLTRAERKAYTLWLLGTDIEDQYARTGAWSMTKRIYDKTGIWVKSKKRPVAMPDLDLRDVFSPDNVLPVPDWLLSTEFYSKSRGYGIGAVPLDWTDID